jgi:hypothetical protein
MLTIDGSEVIAFSLQLRDVPTDLRPELRRNIIDAANVIAAAARSNASWSSRIPDAISARVRFGTGSAVQIVVSAAKAPHARAFEGIGARARDYRGGTFRHPVFGRDIWVEQQQRPFLVPAVQQHEDAAVRGVQSAIDAVFKRL